MYIFSKYIMKTRQAVMKDERRKKSDKKRIYTHIYIYIQWTITQWSNITTVIRNPLYIMPHSYLQSCSKETYSHSSFLGLQLILSIHFFFFFILFIYSFNLSLSISHTMDTLSCIEKEFLPAHTPWTPFRIAIATHARVAKIKFSLRSVVGNYKRKANMKGGIVKEGQNV